jgi:putative SOS response-associated peptidase YedK
MCGRYTNKLAWEQIVNLYRLTLPEEPPIGLKPHLNVASPTHVMPIIRPAGNGRELVMAAWGLIPFWMKKENLGKQAYSTCNARSDRIATAPTFRELFKKRRCIVPTTGWYEWQKLDAKSKKPFHFRRRPRPSPLRAFGMPGAAMEKSLSEQSESAARGCQQSASVSTITTLKAIAFGDSPAYEVP